MKAKFLAIALALVALLATMLNANAQQRYDNTYSLTALGASAPSLVGPNGTNVAWVIDARQQSSISLQLNLFSNTNGVYAFAFPVQRSGDGVYYTPTDTELITFTITGNYTNTVFTNISTKGLGFIKIPWLTNSAGSSQTATVTNIQALPIIKRGVPQMDRN